MEKLFGNSYRPGIQLAAILLFAMCASYSHAETASVFAVADQLKQKGQIHKANYYYHKAIDQGINIEQAYYGLADSSYRMKDYEAALNQLKKLLSINSVNEPGLLLRSKIYINTNRFNKALTDLKVLESSNSANPEVYMLLDSVYTSLGDDNSAKNAKQKYHDFNSKKLSKGLKAK